VTPDRDQLPPAILDAFFSGFDVTGEAETALDWTTEAETGLEP
jgi:hypothetical protein